MGKLKSVDSHIWEDSWVEELDPLDKLIWLYLITNKNKNMLGVYERSIKRISFDTGIKKERVQKALKGFERVGKAYYKENYIVLVNHFKNQKMNPNMWKSATKKYNNLPNSIKTIYKNKALKGFERLLNRSKGFEKLKYKLKLKSEDEDKDKEALVDKSTWPVLSKLKRKNNFRQYPDQFEKLWGKYPKRNGSNPKGSCYKKVRARINDNIDFELLLQSVNNYKDECKNKDNINTQYVQMGSTFFGSSEAWVEYIDKNYEGQQTSKWETTEDLPKNHPLYGTKTVN